MSYNNQTASTVTATTNGHWTRSTMDGLGRTIKVEKGDGSGTKSITESRYAPCACSPMGKVSQLSQPYAPGGSPVWTNYTYDALGRTLTIVKPDGSTTRYAYAGNVTTVTDAAGNWKKFTTDAVGNLTQVQEPDPGTGGGGSNVAVGKSASQSSNPFSVSPGRAVDGNTDGNWADNSVTHTGNDTNAWWQVDLASSYLVSSIVIWNRTDCCQDRLSDYWVFVSDTAFGPSDTPATLVNRPGTWSNHQTSATGRTAAWAKLDSRLERDVCTRSLKREPKMRWNFDFCAFRCRFMVPMGLFAFALAAIVGCRMTCAFQSSLLDTLAAERFSLVEVGSFGQMRILRFPGASWESKNLTDQGSPIGTSANGDLLLINILSTRKAHPVMHDTIQIETLDGRIISSIHPAIRGMLAYYAELSPDGQRIAFVGNFARFGERGSFGLHLIEVSGEIRSLVSSSESKVPQSIGWSSDGKAIVYDSNNRLLVYHLETGTSTELVPGSSPTWSPDGMWIAYRRPDGSPSLIAPDGSHSRELLKGIRIRRGLRWSPDSRYVLLTDAGTDEIRVFALADGRNAKVLAPTDGYDESRLRWVRALN